MGWVVAIVLGALTWTLLEYVLHRWVMHTWTRPTQLRTEHLEHHRQREYFASRAMKARGALTAGVLFLSVSVPVVGLALGAVYAAAAIATYLAYEAFHMRLHLRPPTTAFGRFARKHHFHHHHGDLAANHGVTSPVWDVVFRTYTPVTKVRVPAAKAPRWLEADEARYADDYEVVRRPARA